jgi:hypothetical protein
LLQHVQHSFGASAWRGCDRRDYIMAATRLAANDARQF